MLRIIRDEGPASMWRGLSPTLLIAVPQTVFYFVAYERLRDGYIKELAGSYSPAISGALARSIGFALTKASLLQLHLQRN
jgi:solute carrier family 25 protein 39/40